MKRIGIAILVLATVLFGVSVYNHKFSAADQLATTSTTQKTTKTTASLSTQKVSQTVQLGSLRLSIQESAKSTATDIAFQVTNTNDSGSGSLREAITEANTAPGVNSVVFAIPGSGPKVIQLLSELPAITDSVHIDGYSQAGSSLNTAVAPQSFNGVLSIELRGSQSINNCLHFMNGISSVSGIAIQSCNDAGIFVEASDTTIQGNYIGTDASGMVNKENPTGVKIRDAQRVIIGGTKPADRNVISGNRDMNIYMERSDNTVVQGNYLGIAANGTVLPSNAWYGLGIISSKNVQVGGNQSGAVNVISASQVQAGFLSSGDNTAATGNKIQGNYLNTNTQGQDQAGYSSLYAGFGMGGNVQDTLFGGAAPGEGNVIGGSLMFANVAAGSMSGYIANKNSFIGNKVTTASDALGFDLGEIPPAGQPLQLGRTPNDVGDHDTGSNTYINYPELTEASATTNTVDIKFSLDIDDGAVGVNGYRIEFFANDSVNANGDSSGQYMLGTTTVSGDVTDRTVTVSVPANLDLRDKYITATTTEIDGSLDGFGSTSEFSVPLSVQRRTVVSNTNDSGAGSFRQAILDTNASAGPDIIVFSIPGTGVHSIKPLSPLPYIEDTVIIDGYTQPGSVPNSAPSPQPLNSSLKIEIDGSNLPVAEYESRCIKLRNAHNSVIRGLVVNRCGSTGIGVVTSNYLQITGNYVGTDANGFNDLGNGRDLEDKTRWSGNGINIESSNHFRIGGLQPEDRNIIAGNQANDIFFGNESDNPNLSEYNVIQGNYIGVARDGVTALPAGYMYGHCNAILNGNSHHDLIGGTEPGATNVIASSYEFGVSYRDGSSFSRLEGNLIGTDYTGTRTMPHALGSGNAASGVHVAVVSSIGDGMHLTRAPHDIMIGGTNPAARNIISGNTYNGGTPANGVILHEGTYNTSVIGNYIGTDITGTASLPNDGNGVTVLTDNGYESHDNVVTDNLIRGQANGGATGIDLSMTPRNTILGNSITGFGNGISVSGNNNQIGKPGRGNIISSFQSVGIMLAGGEGAQTENSSVQSNTITNRTGTNLGVGIFILGKVTDSLIGGVESAQANTISQVNGLAIGVMQRGQDVPRKNSILGNISTQNGHIGIDLFSDVTGDYQPDLYMGATPNDNNDEDIGPNDLLNTATITAAALSNGQLQASFNLDIPDADIAPGGYRVEFYASTTANAGGDIYIGSTEVTGDVVGQQVSLPSTLPANQQYWITATVTEIDASSNGFGSTSEFSAPFSTSTSLSRAMQQQDTNSKILDPRRQQKTLA